MKKILVSLAAVASFSAFADSPQLNNLSKSDVEEVGNEFAVNFSHTAVAAPETDGLWGIEVGLVGARTSTPKLSDVVDESGGDGGDFKNAYSGGLLVRAHFPYELFAEVTYLPQMSVSEVEVQNKTLGVGWNAGSQFNLPLDLAIGYNYSTSDVSFDQSSTGGVAVSSTINLNSQASVYWIGVSKEFAFITPYLKTGLAHTQSEVDVDTNASSTIFTYTNSQKETVHSSGAHLALGANLQFLFFRLGVEASQTIGVKRVAAKLSVAF